LPERRERIFFAAPSSALFPGSTHLNEPVQQNQLLAFIEIPKGSRNKYEYDEGLDRVVFDRFLSGSTVYPTDYGFLPGHLGEDGDPLDCLVVGSEPTFPGCVTPVKPVALFKMRDEKGADDKVICVPVRDPRWSHIESLDDVPEQLQQEVEHFFNVYKNLEDKPVETDGWHPLSDAERTIEEARRRQLEANPE
jgi:inorganic pyrophosphatase